MACAGISRKRPATTSTGTPSAWVQVPRGVLRPTYAPERIRTSDLRFRRPTLYPAELRAQVQRLRAVLHLGGPAGPPSGPCFIRFDLVGMSASARGAGRGPLV